jgi:hypothetical protein
MDVSPLGASDSALSSQFQKVRTYETFLKTEKLPAFYVVCVTMMPSEFFAVT